MALTVYKASAGSGKTFTLASEYISLLVKEPDDYTKILAVTFTNKATQEMKMRILAQLYGIAHKLPESQSYYDKIAEKVNLPEFTIRENAAKALSHLTHHYNEFRVQTIDAFFQTVLRNLARELNLTANLRLDLNDEQVAQQAVDEMINDLEEGEEVLEWLRDYINKNIEDDQSWNVIGQIKDFAENIFKDFYKDAQEEIEQRVKDPKFFPYLITKLRQIRNDSPKKMNKMASGMLEKIRNAGVDDVNYFYKGTKGVYPFIKKLSTSLPFYEPHSSYIQTCIDDADKWTSGQAKKEPNVKETILRLAHETLRNDLVQLEEERSRAWKAYKSSTLTLKHISQLRLLQAIAERVDEMNKDLNRFMLSNTQTLLSTLIKDSDTPFVFEKMGAYLKHIMIDEFQDTSTIQWNNFRKLLDHCLAQVGSEDLIVGDVKQSIYRWRQGDWRLLNNIESHFPSEQIKVKSLDTNYRSEENIIRFNNAFFAKAVEQNFKQLEEEHIPKANELQEAYKEVAQYPKKQDGKGYVHISLYPSKNREEAYLTELTDTVKMLLDKGAQQKDIAILIRKKEVIQQIADYFVRTFGSEVSIVSDEAFRLDASLAVNVIIEALHLITHQNDKLTIAKLKKLYCQQVLQQPITDNELFNSEENREQFLPNEYINRLNDLQKLSLLDLVDELYTIFQLDKLDGQSAYICTFYDTLNEYLREHPADIDDFIEEWEENLSSKTIQSDDVDGIRLITIHKSKGLEYDHVLLPYCDWTLEKQQNNTIWCPGHSKEAPYCDLPIIPIDFSRKSMEGTVFEEDYKEEHFQNIVDNMNLLYVAFTRAGKSLFIMGQRDSKKSNSKKTNKSSSSERRSLVIEKVLPSLEQQLENSTLVDNPEDPTSVITFEYGTFPSFDTQGNEETKDSTSNAETEEREKGNPFTSKIKTHPVRIETFPYPITFRQSNKSKDFIHGNEEEDDDRKHYISIGNILHNLFSTILTEKDIEPTLQALETEGIIYNDEVTSKELRRKIKYALNNKEVKNWFSGKWELFNECTIAEYDEATGMVLEHRPDRVMTDGKEYIVVDFKFGNPHDAYQRQVKRYMSLLKKMGYQKVTGYLWYVMRNKVEPITI